MALPTASLGGLASLNVPSFIPTQVVPKEPKLWQQALIGLLAKAAGTAVAGGIENEMGRDYAGEFGKTEAGGLDKLLHGPTVDEKQATNLRHEKSVKEGQMRDISANANRDKFKAVQDMLLQASQIGAQGDLAKLANARTDAEIGSRENIAGQEMGLRDRLSAAELRGSQLTEQIKGERARLQQQREIEAERPLREAQTKKAGAEGDTAAVTAQLMQRALQGGGQTAPGAGVSPAVAKFAQNQTAPLTGDAARVAEALRTNPPGAEVQTYQTGTPGAPIPGNTDLGRTLSREELLQRMVALLSQ